MLASSVVRRQRTQMEVPRVVEQRGAPFFSFSLRPRLIQKNNACKLLCTVTGNPPPKIEWLKDGQPVDEERVQTLFKSGVASLEIFNTRPQDAGVYTCVASNELGQDETSAPVAVETRQSGTGYLQQSHQSAAHAILARSARRSCTRSVARRAQTPGSVATERRAVDGDGRRGERYASLFPASSTSDIASAVSSAEDERRSSVDDALERRSASVVSSNTSK
uniref:Ig-like domain-containing protein n=1 Tax=Globodera pallida TaxID=36090 RepID=A0A183CMM2_GLOPA